MNKVKCNVCHKEHKIDNITLSTLKDGSTNYLCPNCEAFLTDITFLQEIETRTKIVENGPTINNPVDLIAFADDIADCDSEKMLIFYISSCNQIICYSTLTSGFVADVMVSPRHIIKNAILCGAVGVVVIHNHPSGKPDPSEMDYAIVEKLNGAFSYIDSLRLMDFIIVTQKEYWSMAQERNIDQ
jgi:DNA repair protein RadC